MTSNEIERQGRDILFPYLQHRAKNKQAVLTEKGRLSFEFQTTVGDALYNNSKGNIIGVEFKVEAENKHGNFFLETWSNLTFDSRYRKPGWLYTLHTDYIWYYFLNTDQLYIIDFSKLFHWAFSKGGRVFDFPEKEQNKYNQKNATWGRCVPIETVKSEVGFWPVSPKSKFSLHHA